MIDQALRAVAGANSGLNVLIGALPDTRFYLVLAPQQPTYPYCVFHLISETVPNAMGPTTDLIVRRYQVDCWAKDQTAAAVLAKAVTDCFDRYSGALTPSGFSQTTIQDIYRKGGTDIFDAEARRFKRSVDLEVWYQES